MTSVYYSIDANKFPIVEAMENDMHRNDFVYGDIREAVSKNRKTFMFLDFGWAEKIGGAGYPVDMKGVDFLTRPDGEIAQSRGWFLYCVDEIVEKKREGEDGGICRSLLV